MRESAGAPFPSASLTGVSACNCILAEVYYGRGRHPQMKACQTSNGALLTLSCDPAPDMRADVPPGPRMPAFDAEWAWLDLPHLNVGARRGLFTNSCQASFCPCCRCQGSILLTDRLQQMVLEAPGGILQTGFDDLFLTGEWVTRAAQSYTNRWDGGFPWLQALLSSVDGPTLKKTIRIFINLMFKH